MSEKTSLLPTAPAETLHIDPTLDPNGARGYARNPEFRVLLMPGLEFDPTRRYRYGLHSLASAILIFIAFTFVELRNCKWSPGINLDTLQALHVVLMLAALTLYLLSLFGIADFMFKYKIAFYVGFIIIVGLVGLMLWTTYEAATNPCVASSTKIPIDISIGNKNVFLKNDAIGIFVLLLDIFATVFLISATFSFYKRY